MKFDPLVVIVLGLVTALFFISVYPILPIASGSVTGELVSFEVKPIDYDYQTYAWTKVVLRNYTITGDMPDWSNTFFFDGEYSAVENLVIGNVYQIEYKRGSRPSDTTSGDNIIQYYLLGINEVKK